MRTILVTHLALFFFMIPNFAWAQLVTVSGYVNNGTNGKAMKNVSIFEANSGIGTITNKYGFYKLVLKEGDFNFSVTSSGFKPFVQKLELKSDTVFVVKLQPILHLKTKEKKDTNFQVGVKSERKRNERNGIKIF